VHQGLQALDLEDKTTGPPNSGTGYRPPPGTTPYDHHEEGPSSSAPPPQPKPVAPRPGLAGGNVAPTQEELESFQAAVDKMWDLDVNRLQPGVDYEIEVRDRLSDDDGGLRCGLSWVAQGSLYVGLVKFLPCMFCSHFCSFLTCRQA
jgi:hypothetical protein